MTIKIVLQNTLTLSVTLVIESNGLRPSSGQGLGNLQTIFK
jgi:hypothetical protein